MAFLGMVVMTAISIALIAVVVMIFGLNLLPIPVLIVLFIYFSSTAFMAAYAAYPIIDRYMIAPYVDQEKDEEAEAPSSDA